MNNIFITGAQGFIGKNLVEYLARDIKKGYFLFYPDHGELELFDADKVLQFINDNKIDVVIHCANTGGSRKTGYDIKDPYVAENNLRMFFNLTRCLGQAKLLINLGSGAEYDRAYYKPKMNEDYFDRHVPSDRYGFSKYICSKYISNSQNSINLRLFGVFGKYEDHRFRFISNAIVKNLSGLPITINKNVYFDYLYVNDLMKVLEYFIHNPARHKNYNVCTGKVIDLATIADMINKISEKPSEVIIKNQGLNPEYSGDNSRMLEELGEFDFTPFNEALKELFLWHKNNINEVDKELIKKDEYLKYCR